MCGDPSCGSKPRVVQTKEATMADYATLLRDHVTLTCRSVDRIFCRRMCRSCSRWARCASFCTGRRGLGFPRRRRSARSPHRHHTWLPEAQCGCVLAINDRRPGHLGEGGHIRSGPGMGGKARRTDAGWLFRQPTEGPSPSSGSPTCSPGSRIPPSSGSWAPCSTGPTPAGKPPTI